MSDDEKWRRDYSCMSCGKYYSIRWDHETPKCDCGNSRLVITCYQTVFSFDPEPDAPQSGEGEE